MTCAGGGPDQRCPFVAAHFQVDGQAGNVARINPAGKRQLPTTRRRGQNSGIVTAAIRARIVATLAITATPPKVITDLAIASRR